MKWTTACPDWERRILAGGSLVPAPIFPQEAAEALRVFDDLRMVDAPGSPRMGDVSRPWLRHFVAALFGAYDRDAGRQLIREALLLISKKNGKSTDAAAIMMTALIRNWRAENELLIFAPTVLVAGNSFDPAHAMVRADEELSDLFHVQPHTRTITNRETRAKLRVVAAEDNTAAGTKGGLVLIDELWLFGKRSNAHSMLMEATGGQASRPEGMVIYLTTQSDEPPAGVFRDKLSYARKVRDGEISDPAFLPVLYEHPTGMVESGACRDLANAWITNPNMGASVDEEFLRREHQKASAGDAGAMQVFLAKHLNVQIGQSLRGDRWAGADFWQGNGDHSLTLQTLIERSEVVVVGIDGGGLDDLLGLAVIGREKATGEWLHWGHAWAHPSVLERRQTIASKLRDYASDGDLTIVQRVGDDTRAVAEIVARLDATGLLDKIGVDQAGIGSILDALADEGIEADRIVGISQGWRLVGAIKTAERRLAEGALHHGATRLMAWAVGNAKVEPRGNAVAITKQAAGVDKIDPLMALLNAVELMSRNPQRAPTPAIFFV